MRPSAGALAAFEVAVRRRGAALARLEDVRVHAEAHRAAGAAPLEAGGEEDLVQTLLLGLAAHGRGARHDERGHGRVDPLALDERGRGPEILDARVRARADE